MGLQGPGDVVRQARNLRNLDPRAELDNDALSRLMGRVVALGSQVIATSLVPDAGLFPAPARTFHVEHGVLQADT